MALKVISLKNIAKLKPVQPNIWTQIADFFISRNRKPKFEVIAMSIYSLSQFHFEIMIEIFRNALISIAL